MKGRLPKPTAIKKLTGNPGKRKMSAREPLPERDFAAEPPKWLDQAAREEWQRVVPELQRLGLLTMLDASALAIYCDAFSTFVRASKALNEHGLVFATKTKYLAPLPYVAIKNQAALIIRQYCQEFGLTPSSRTRLSGTSSPDGEESPMEALLMDTSSPFKTRRGA